MTTASPQLVHNEKVSIPAASATTAKKITCEFLTEAEYAEWDQFVDRSPHGTVFHYSWWLNIAASAFRLLVARDKYGYIVAGIPLPSKRVAGLKLFHSPALTPYLGPIFDLPDSAGVCDRLFLMRSYGEALARGIDQFDSFRYIAGACAPDLQGFLWAGFRVSLGYTFRFSAGQSMEEICKGVSRTHMRNLTKAKHLDLRIVRDDGVETLLELNKMSFKRQGSRPTFADPTLLGLWKAAAERQQANLYLANTAEGYPVAGLLTFHDARTTYQIVSGINSAYPDIPGQHFVLWTALQDALNAGRDFDFEGSGMRGVETFFRRWGARAVPVWRIEKAGTLRGTLAQAAIRYKDAKCFQNSTRA